MDKQEKVEVLQALIGAIDILTEMRKTLLEMKSVTDNALAENTAHMKALAKANPEYISLPE